MFRATFHVISWKFGLLFEQLTVPKCGQYQFGKPPKAHLFKNTFIPNMCDVQNSYRSNLPPYKPPTCENMIQLYIYININQISWEIEKDFPLIHLAK